MFLELVNVAVQAGDQFVFLGNLGTEAADDVVFVSGTFEKVTEGSLEPIINLSAKFVNVIKLA